MSEDYRMKCKECGCAHLDYEETIPKGRLTVHVFVCRNCGLEIRKWIATETKPTHLPPKIETALDEESQIQQGHIYGID